MAMSKPGLANAMLPHEKVAELCKKDGAGHTKIPLVGNRVGCLKRAVSPKCVHSGIYHILEMKKYSTVRSAVFALWKGLASTRRNQHEEKISSRPREASRASRKNKRRSPQSTSRESCEGCQPQHLRMPRPSRLGRLAPDCTSLPLRLEFFKRNPLYPGGPPTSYLPQPSFLPPIPEDVPIPWPMYALQALHIVYLEHLRRRSHWEFYWHVGQFDFLSFQPQTSDIPVPWAWVCELAWKQGWLSFMAGDPPPKELWWLQPPHQ